MRTALYSRRKDDSRQLIFPLCTLILLCVALCLPACASAGRHDGDRAAEPSSCAPSENGHWQGGAVVPAQWQELRARLAADGVSGPRVDALLADLGPRTQSPMGRKMVELYKKNFMPAPKAPASPRDEVYKGVVTKASAKLCRDYIKANQKAFDRARTRYGVPASVAASLLFVETRLGAVLQDVPENALLTLASMSQSTTMDSISDWLQRMPGCESKAEWFAQTMPKRAAWAYQETKALVRYMLDNNISADHLPGSIYGAIGLCQFMPSNITPYGVDGNGDGVVDLYQADDAVMSLSFYLHKHGWKASSPRTARHAVLMRYNKSVKYANTILALADLVDNGKAPAREPAKKTAQQEQAGARTAK